MVNSPVCIVVRCIAHRNLRVQVKDHLSISRLTILLKSAKEPNPREMRMIWRQSPVNRWPPEQNRGTLPDISSAGFVIKGLIWEGAHFGRDKSPFGFGSTKSRIREIISASHTPVPLINLASDKNRVRHPHSNPRWAKTSLSRLNRCF